MINEFKAGKQQHRGIRAEELLGEGSLFNEASQELEKLCLQQWRNSKAYETAERENAWRTLKAMDAMHGLLKSYVLTGRIAAEDLRRLGAELERKQKAKRNG